MSEQIEPLREKIIDILRQNGAKRASFFGSIVRGEMTDESDVDLLVEFEGRRSLLDLAHLKNELEDAVDRLESGEEVPQIGVGQPNISGSRRITERLPRVSAAEAARVLEKTGFFWFARPIVTESIRMQRGAG